MTTEANMWQVVARLRTEGSEAVLELVEFDQALEEFLQNLEQIAPTVEALQLVTAKIVDLREGEAFAWMAVRDQVISLGTWLDRFQTAFRELRAAVQGWNIADTGTQRHSP